MSRRIVALALFAALAASACSSTSTSSSPEAARAAALAQTDPDRLVCRREHVVGNVRPQRVCMTARERQVALDAARDATRDDRTTAHPTQGGGVPGPG